MIGWGASSTPTSQVFEVSARLQQIVAWDGREQRYLRSWLGRYDELPTLEPGMGLWLYIVGDEPVEWTRPLSGGSLLLDLHEGHNFIGWTGQDGVDVADVLSQLGDSFVSAWQWDSVAQRFDFYFEEQSSRNTLSQLGRGAALWVVLSADARWWAPGVALPRFAFPSEMSVEDRDALRTTVESVRGVFARRFGVHTADFEVRVGGSECGVAYRDVIYLSSECSDGRWVVAHEYFHILQGQLGRWGEWGPVWLTEGTAIYAAEVDWGVTSTTQTVDEYLAMQRRSNIGCAPREPRDWTPLLRRDSRTGEATCLMGLVGDVLVDSSGEQSIIGYYKGLSSGRPWMDVFREIFGISVEEFYEEFSRYIRDLPPLYPHFADKEVTPALVSLGDYTSEERDVIHTDILALQEFFSVRFGAPPVEYTIYIGDTEALSAKAEAMTGWPFPEERGVMEAGPLLFLNLNQLQAPYVPTRYHHSHVVDRLAPWESLPQVPEGFNRLGPQWLVRGLWEYIYHAYEEELGVHSLDQIRNQNTGLAVQTARRLSSMEEVNWFDEEAGDWPSLALPFLAADWLAGHAGEAALLDYYRQLPSTAKWQEAFEVAFGLGSEDFYEAFESYRITLQER